ncbi:MAG: hypothetical protein ABSF45_03270 [Terriglobia bacterium]|jgi:hypothetical protein
MKHAAAELTEDAILSHTRNGPSLFYQSYSASDLKNTFWSWFLCFFGIVNSRHLYYAFVTPNTADYNRSRANLWRKFLAEPHLRIAFDAMRPIGACHGASTSYVCFDIHIDGKIVHCYPITSDEAARIMGKDDIERIDALNH